MHGLILAGGGARRMGGGDKPLVRLGAGTLLDHVIGAVGPQVAGLALSANGDPARFAGWGLPVLADAVAGWGPLGGMLAGLRWAAGEGARGLLVAPGDTPFLPADLATRLGGAGARIAYAASGGRAHYAVALIDVGLADDLAGALDGGVRAVRDWMGRHRAVAVDWVGGPDPFQNVNTPDDLAAAAGRLNLAR
jgi:molybdopterin-guanine dinucleotide biosynthesis protein A